MLLWENLIFLLLWKKLTKRLRDREPLKIHLKNECVALARQNARSDRVCLDFSLVTFFVAMTKKVTIKNKTYRI